MLLTRLGRTGALVFASLLIGATALYALGWIWYAAAGPSARMGIEFEYLLAESELVVTAVEPGSPAEAGGLQPGDRIVAIDGAPLVTQAPLYDSIFRGRPGESVHLTLRRDDRGSGRSDELRIVLGDPRRVPDFSPLRLFAVEALRLYPVGFLVVMALLLLQRPQDRNAWLVALLFAGFIAAAPVDPGYAHPWLRRYALAYATIFRGLVPPLFFALFAVFPARSPVDRRFPSLKNWLLGIGLLVSVPLAAMVGSAGTWDPLVRLSERIGPRLVEFAIGFFAVLGFGGGTASLIWSYRAAHMQARRRSRVIVWGTVIGVTPMLLLQTVARGSGVYEFPFWVWAPAVFALFLLPFSFAYAVVRYKVIEIPLLLKRSARYLLVQRGFILLVAALGLAASIALALWFPRIAPHRPELAVPAGLLVGVAFGIALSWGATHVHRDIASRIDRAFFRSAYDARLILEDLAVQAARTTSREELADLLRNCLDDALKPVSIVVYVQRESGVLSALTGAVPSGLEAVDAHEPAFAVLIEDPEPFIVEPTEGEHPLPVLEPLSPECVVPMIGRTGLLAGLLVLGPRRSDDPYSREDRRLLASIGRQAGMALESMSLAEQMAARLESERRVAQELAIAQEVQTRLLPQGSPSIRTLEVHGACLQARAVGGDFYDFLDLGDGEHALVLADISGKGISAALLMANLQAHLRAHCLAARQDPAAWLTSVDRYLFDTTAAYHYATLFFGLYDDASCRFTYVNCGHNPPLLLRGSAAALWLTPTAPAVGLLPVWSCTVGHVSLTRGDTLIIYSDGVTEAMDDAGECFGEDRLLALAERTVHLPTRAFIDGLIDDVRQFSGAVQEDDLTLVVARVR